MIYAKAVVGALIAGLGALASALTDGGVTMAEWVTVASATLIAFAGVWSIPNATVKDHAAEHEAK